MKREHIVGDVFTPHGAEKVPHGSRAALYLRVSTEEQTAENQRPELVSIVKMRKLGIVREYHETGSAAKRRPAYEAMMADAHAGRFDVVIVWALDRFGRSALGNLQAVFELDQRGVRLISAREPWIDAGGPTRSLLIFIFSWVAEQERLRLIERTKVGMARARAQGKSIGRPKAHVHVPTARALLTHGTRADVARKLGVSTASLDRALRSSKGGSSEGGSKPHGTTGARRGRPK